jgi:plasmid maintenance system antidote protein VapI
MLGYMFENRNSTLKSVIKIADCLGRSLRENVQLFSIDSENSKVSFLTESGHVIEGSYSFSKSKLTLNDIQVQDSKVFSDNESFDGFVSEEVKSFVGGLHESSYGNAETSFEKILRLWETRLQFNEVKKKLEEKSNVFSSTQNIISTSEFQNFLEIAPQVITWLHENKRNITSVPEIKNAIKLSTSVSHAFDIPKQSLKELQENQSISFENQTNKTIYEMICRQELVAKELTESKESFDLIWANNLKINNLASLVYTGDQDKIAKTLSEALSDVPYLALATKKQLRETFSKNLQLENTPPGLFSDKDIKSFASVIFEMKKPVKDLLIKTINEKYGVNIQNLKEVASFRGLVEAQIVIFESLSRLAPKSSVVKEVLNQVSIMLKEKSGVEAIDVNDILQAIFEKADYASLYETYSISDKITLKEMFENDLSSQQIISLLEAQTDNVEEKIRVLREKKNRLLKRQDEDEGEGYPEKGIKGGTNAAKKEAKKKKGSDDPQTPEEVQKRLSGVDDTDQYGEATEPTSDKETASTEGEQGGDISKEDFIKSLDDFTKIFSGDDKKKGASKKEEK